MLWKIFFCKSSNMYISRIWLLCALTVSGYCLSDHMNTGTVNDERPRSSHPRVTPNKQTAKNKQVARVLHMVWNYCVMERLCWGGGGAFLDALGKVNSQSTTLVFTIVLQPFYAIRAKFVNHKRLTVFCARACSRPLVFLCCTRFLRPSPPATQRQWQQGKVKEL